MINNMKKRDFLFFLGSIQSYFANNLVHIEYFGSKQTIKERFCYDSNDKVKVGIYIFVKKEITAECEQEYYCSLPKPTAIYKINEGHSNADLFYYKV